MAAAFIGMMPLYNSTVLLCAICCFGTSYFALTSFCATCIMRLPGISPFAASAGISMMSACGSLLAIFVPGVQQVLANRLGLQMALLLPGCLLVPAFWGAVKLSGLEKQATDGKICH